MSYISVLFIYYITKVFTYKETSIQETELTQQLSYHGDANTNSFVESNHYLLAVNRNYRRTSYTSVGTNKVSSLLTVTGQFECATGTVQF